MSYKRISPIIVAEGGTGAQTLSANSLLLGNNTSAVSALGVASNGQLPIGSAGANPVLAALSTANGMNVANAAGSITLKNMRDVGRYVVSSVAGQATYSTVQSAITQAVADGASSSAPAVVWIFPGIYTENLTIADFVYLASASDAGVQIVGNASYTPGANGRTFHANQINFQTPGGGGSSFAIAGTHSSTVDFDGCTFTAGTGASGSGFSCSNANATVNFYDCVFTTTHNSFNNLAITNCTAITLYNCSSSSTDTNSTIAGSGLVTIISGLISDSFTLSGTCTLHVHGTDCEAIGTTSFVTVGAGCTLKAHYAEISSSAVSGFWVTGTGSLVYGCVIPDGSAQNINPTLTITSTLTEVDQFRVNLAGVLSGSTTGNVTASAITQHDVLVGGATNAIASVAPSATSGVPLISQGAAADPAFGTAVVAGGGTGAVTFTAYSVITAGTTATAAFQNVSGVGTAGQVLTSAGSSALPTWSNPTGILWAVTTVDASIVAGNGYIANKAGLLTMTLPASSAIGDMFEITGINTALGWKIAQNANQVIHFGTSNTTTGAGGSLASSQIRDSVRLVCVVSGASAEWNVISSIGNITVV